MSRKGKANFIPVHCSFGGTEKRGSLAGLSSVLLPTAAGRAGSEERVQARASRGESKGKAECVDGAMLGPAAPAPSATSRSCLSHLLHPLSLSLTPSCCNLRRPCSKLEELFFHSALLTLDLFSDWQPRCFPGMAGKERSFLHFN